MGKNAQDVVAGGASVRVGANTEPFHIDIDKVEARMKLFGTKAVALGAKVGSFGIVLGTGLISAATSFAHAGTELDDLAKRTGDNVRNLSAMKFAAAQTGASLEDLQGGLTDMSANLGKANVGDQQMNKNLSRLGLTAQSLKGKLPTEQLKMLAEGLRKISNQSERTDLVKMIFDGSGVKLLPLLEQGAAGIDDLTQEAERLGIVMSNEDAAAAAKLKDAFGGLSGAIQGVVNKVGAALAPVMTGTVEYFARAGSAIAQFVADNRSLVIQAGLVVAGMTAVGAAIAGVGVVAYALGSAIGLVSGFITVLTSVLSVQNAMWLASKIAVTAASVVTAGYQAVIGSLSGILVMAKGIILGVSLAVAGVKMVMAAGVAIGSALSATYGAIATAASFASATIAAFGALETVLFLQSTLCTGAIAALGAAVSFLASPFGVATLAIGALIAGAGYLLVSFLSTTTIIQDFATFVVDSFKGIGTAVSNAFGNISQMVSSAVSSSLQFFGQLSSTAMSAFKGISNALAAGDMQKAVDIFWAATKVAWLQGTEAIKKAWDASLIYIKGALDSVGNTLGTIWAGIVGSFTADIINIEGMWDTLSTNVGAVWSKMITNIQGAIDIFVTYLRKAMIDVMANIRKGLVALDFLRHSASARKDMQAKIDASSGAEKERLQKEADARAAARQKELDAIDRGDEIEARRRDRQQRLEDASSTVEADEAFKKREKERQTQLDALASGPSDALAQAQAEFQALLAQSAAAAIKPTTEQIDAGKKGAAAAAQTGASMSSAAAQARNSAGAASAIAKSVNSQSTVPAQQLVAMKATQKASEKTAAGIKKLTDEPRIVVQNLA